MTGREQNTPPRGLLQEGNNLTRRKRRNLKRLEKIPASKQHTQHPEAGAFAGGKVFMDQVTPG